MKICICEKDEEVILLKNKIIADYFLERNVDFNISLFNDAEALLVSGEGAGADIIIIDTYLGDTDGISLVRELKETCKNKIYILTSDNYDFLDEAMDLGVTRYILNSAEKEKYYSALDKAVDDINSYVIRIKSSDLNIYSIHKNDIVYVEARGRKSRILSTSGIIETNMSIAQMKKKLNTPNFINPHYSFIVNSDYISHIEGKDILVKVNYHYFRIPIATRRCALTKKQLLNS